MGALTIAAFTYEGSGLPEDIAMHARAAAARINSRSRQMQKAIYEIGLDLIWAKRELGHGHFLPWLASEAGMSPSTAKRYMDVAEHLPPQFVTVTNLAPATLYAIAAPSTPVEIRAAIVERVEAGAPVSDQEIRDKLESVRYEARIAKLTRPRRRGRPVSPEQAAQRDKREGAARRRHERDMLKRDAEVGQAARRLVALLGEGDAIAEALSIFERFPAWEIRRVFTASENSPDRA